MPPRLSPALRKRSMTFVNDADGVGRDQVMNYPTFLISILAMRRNGTTGTLFINGEDKGRLSLFDGAAGLSYPISFRVVGESPSVSILDAGVALALSHTHYLPKIRGKRGETTLIARPNYFVPGDD